MSLKKSDVWIFVEVVIVLVAGTFLALCALGKFSQ
jgi:hypothetical protein